MAKTSPFVVVMVKRTCFYLFSASYSTIDGWWANGLESWFVVTARHNTTTRSVVGTAYLACASTFQDFIFSLQSPLRLSQTKQAAKPMIEAVGFNSIRESELLVVCSKLTSGFGGASDNARRVPLGWFQHFVLSSTSRSTYPFFFLCPAGVKQKQNQHALPFFVGDTLRCVSVGLVSSFSDRAYTLSNEHQKMALHSSQTLLAFPSHKQLVIPRQAAGILTCCRSTGSYTAFTKPASTSQSTAQCTS